MKRLALGILLVLLAVNAFTAPRAYGSFGALSVANLAITVPFNPKTLCVANDDAAIVIYVDFTDGVATSASGSTNIAINPAVTKEKCWNFEDKNVNNTFIVGIIAASGTPAYRLDATR